MPKLNWFEGYIGKPWQANPNPPFSFNCGELIRYIHKEHLGNESAEIEANPKILRECIANMRPAVFGLRPLTPEETVQDFDVCFFSRVKYEDHCGIGAMTADGLMILHCLQGTGVVLENEFEAKCRGFTEISWYRQVDM